MERKSTKQKLLARSRSSMNSTCIYCKETKVTSDFSREHVLPEAFGQFQGALVLHDAVCRECNQYFGNTLDSVLARGSMQGAIRYFRGVRPLKKFSDVDGERVKLSARAPGQENLRQAEFVETPEGEGLAFTPGITYQSISSNKEKFVSLQELEGGKWNESDDIDREQLVMLSHRDAGSLERIRQAFAKLELRVEVLDTIDETEVGQRILVVVDAVKEDIVIYRAIAKVAFNYLAHIMGRDFALQPIFDQVRTFIHKGSGTTNLVKKIDPMKIFGDSEEAARRRGHMLGIELAGDSNTIQGFVEFFGVMTYKVILGRFGQIAVPISAAHYLDVASKKVIRMDAIRPPPGLWIPGKR